MRTSEIRNFCDIGARYPIISLLHLGLILVSFFNYEMNNENLY